MPLKIGKVSLVELRFDAITSVAPFKGQDRAVSDALVAQIGAAFPQPNRTTGEALKRVVWTGRGQAMVLGTALAPIPGASMTDQTDAWACVALEGDGARDVLTRLVPIDLRPARFEVGHTARTLVGHMSAILSRSGDERFDIMVFRSMAGTLVHDLKEAMETIAARS